MNRPLHKIKFFSNYLLLGFFIISASVGCSKKEPVREEVTIEELLGEKKAVKKVEDEKPTRPALDGTFVGELNQNLYENFKTKPHNYTTLIDRFSFETVEKSNFISLSDSTASAAFFKYNFTDTSATMNAFQNWLSCFGSTCEEIQLLEGKKRVEETPLWCGVYDSSIIIIKFSPSGITYKNDLKQTIFKTKGEKLKYTLNVTADSQLKWE